MSYYTDMLKRVEELKSKSGVKVLAIESSCDETSIAIVEDGRKILSNVISSQIEIHTRFGGVVPEVASRNHICAINNVLSEALEKANLTLSDIDAIAVTYGAGLIGALLVGVNFAKALAYSLNVPLIAVNHIKGHLAANYISYPTLEPPFICLIISGGHTSLFEIKDYINQNLIGQTLDDAVGEAFDKVARVVGLGYPGGPKVEKKAKEGEANITLVKQNSTKGTFNFSFSGIKTAVINYAHGKEQKGEPLNEADLCASFQHFVINELTEKSLNATKKYGYTKLVLAGGVSANQTLKNHMISEGEKAGIEVFAPPPVLCTDNAAMIASAGYYNLLNNVGISDVDLSAKASITYLNN